MWAHYADKNRGVCLEFGTDNDVFSGAFQVHYEIYPEPLDLSDESIEGNLIGFLRKSRSWEYEQEYRLISQERRFADPPDTLLTDDGYLTIPAGALKRVIVGCEASKAYCDEVSKLIAGAGAPVVLARVVRDRAQFELSVSNMNNSESRLT